jgi:hypothetical protein
MKIVSHGKPEAKPLRMYLLAEFKGLLVNQIKTELTLIAAAGDY